MSAPGKVLLIGLDGGTYKILEPFAKEGLIPNLARLMDDGASGILRSTVPPISAPAWATFQTGKQPGKHGLFNFFDLSEEGYRTSHDFRSSRVVNHASIQSATIYDCLREGGKKVISINIPLTYPTPEVDGCLISCWLSPPGSKEFTWPRSLADEIPDYRVDQNFGEGMYALTPTGKELDSDFLMDDLADILQKRADAACQFMVEKPWDVCMICFTETDRLHHYLWRAINPKHPEYNSKKVAHERERFRQFYRDLDVQVGRLMETAGDGVNTIVMSDHGFDAPPTRRYNLSHWMVENGWLVTTGKQPEKQAEKEAEDSASLAPERGGNNPLKSVGKQLWKRLVPPSLRDKVYSRMGYVPTPQEVDWQATRAWSFGVNNNLGAICINVRTGDGNGCVEPGPETDELINRIADGLKSLTDPASGRAVVQRVTRREEAYTGPYTTSFPHLLVELDPDFEADYESGFGFSNYRIDPETIYPTGRGNHRPEGICMASGPDISPGKKPEYGLDCIMPTLLHLLGVPVPDDVDGTVMEAFLTPEAQGRKSSGGTGAVEHKFAEPTQEDVEALQDKLRELGYM